MQHLRNTSISSGKIWIDALCINQANDTEKEEQVNLMGEIFKGAKRVLVYPGDVYQDDGKRMADFRSYIALQNQGKSIPGPLSMIGAMEYILQQGWFWRTWLLQEVVLASRVEIILGTETVPWLEFTKVAAKMSHRGKRISRCTCFEEIPPILGLTQSIGKRSNMQLHDLLKKTRGLKASDNRDRIFALLGIAAPNPKYASLVQYGDTTVRHVYAAFARSFIADSSTLDVLSSSADIRLTCSCVRLAFERLEPTWAPHWSAQLPVSYDTSITGKNVFNANAGLRASIEETTADGKMDRKMKSPHWNVLPVRGRRLGFMEFPIVDSRCMDHDFDPPCRFAKKEVSAMCRNACDVAKKCSRYSEEPAEHICFRTFNFHIPTEQDPTHIGQLTGDFWKKIDHCGKMYGPLGPSEPGLGTFYTNVFYRRICTTDSGYFGLVPSISREGDLLCCFAGGCLPYVIRQSNNGCDFKLVGECYIHGVMQGEALRGAKLEDLEVFQLS